MVTPQPKIKSKVRCADGEIGEVVHVIADPLSLDVSHIVVRANGTERQVPVSAIGAVRDEAVQLTCNVAQFSGFPELKREDFISSKEVEIPHLEDRIRVEPGEVLVPLPVLEKNCARRSSFAGFINVIGVLIGLPVVWVNNQTVPYVAFSGKCPHLGCGYKWRSHKTRGQVFLCPCHLSIYDAAGMVLDGPAPRSLDVLPIKVAASGDIEIIDVEYKAGKKEQVRIA